MVHWYGIYSLAFLVSLLLCQHRPLGEWCPVSCYEKWRQSLSYQPLLTKDFLQWFHWTWHCCRWNKYYIRLNLRPVTTALSDVFKEMPTYWTALGPKPLLKTVVLPSQPGLEAGASTPLPEEKDFLVRPWNCCQRQSFGEATMKWTLGSWKRIKQEETVFSE